MKLYYVPTSPYARIVRVLAQETGLADKLELVETTLRDPKSTLLPLNPLGRVPTLVTDDGTVLCESSVAAAYVDSQHGGPRLIPTEGKGAWEMRRLHGLAVSFLDGVTTWGRELRRVDGERSAGVIKAEEKRAGRALDMFEAEVAAGHFSGRVHVGHIVLACALSHLVNRLGQTDWRASHPKLAGWFDSFEARPSMKLTQPPG
jgi:glutathione S-transferase